MDTENLIYLVIGLVGGGIITWIVQYAYSREPNRRLKRIDNRGRAEFAERHDERAVAVQQGDGSYAVNFHQSLQAVTAPTARLFGKITRADGRVEELGELSQKESN